MIQELMHRVLHDNHIISKEEALLLYDQPLELLSQAAYTIRQLRCGDGFELCAIVNGKSGQCSEDCAYCAQSVHHPTMVTSYELLSREALLEAAEKNGEDGILRFSIVTSGRRLKDEDFEAVLKVYRAISARDRVALCASHGLLDVSQCRDLKAAGVVRYHNNLETSRRYFPEVCTTHTYDEKIDTIRAAQAAGLSVCSGGIFGLGETVEDRIEMALTIRDLGVQSVPINILNPIPGTPLAHVTPLSDDEVRRMVAVYRFMLPDAVLRLAGGRGLLADKGAGIFQGGANAAISGDMLTTSGITAHSDRALLTRLGFNICKL